MLGLKPYPNSGAYAETFGHNFREVGRIGAYPQVKDLTDFIAARLGVLPEIVEIELRRYVLTCHEYYPGEILPSKGAVPRRVCRFAAQVGLALLPRQFCGKSRVLVHDWSPGVIDNFYGDVLLRSLKVRLSAGVVSQKGLWRAGLLDSFSRIPDYFMAQRLAARARMATGVELSGFVNYAVRCALAGQWLRRYAAPAVILSGNDNGFPVLLAKAAGAKLILIQNARKTLFSDAAYKYADIFVAMADLEKMGIIAQTGCRFGKIVQLGSIRIANAMQPPAREGAIPGCDLLWISDLEYSGGSEQVFGRYYSMTSEIAAIRVLNELALRSGWSIIYKCRMPDELVHLKSLGLISDKIHYVGRYEMNTYRVALKAEVVMSTLSTVVLEMLGVGKKAGLFNLSGNNNVNADLSQYGLEYTREDTGGLLDFVSSLRLNPPDLGGTVVQDPHYFERLEEIVAEAVS